MKLKANIKAIEMTVAKGDALPVHNDVFEDLRINLREIIHENIGYSEAKTLEYDDRTQTFYIEVSCRTGVGPFFGTFTMQITIDPTKNLLKQLEDLSSTVQRIKDVCFAAEQATEKLKQVHASLKPLP